MRHAGSLRYAESRMHAVEAVDAVDMLVRDAEGGGKRGRWERGEGEGETLVEEGVRVDNLWVSERERECACECACECECG